MFIIMSAVNTMIAKYPDIEIPFTKKQYCLLELKCHNFILVKMILILVYSKNLGEGIALQAIPLI